ncbi:MAG: class II aldolase/adducin family protein [Deltaproteobacteria bacterium]|nr:class II aldolase/adducin family protein [Deltaproteobacteria bacterium]MBW2018124.1 class II aldolase/adducin family protein [Deltaproteobacteria bacterium]MBW2129839.1 class II aldolase/adducin family protein [Deltaproteobacteria bacterium]MBW2305205.1 class II aldolase/adducin family protein [Deltaproteobacteria bacterium]
MDEEGIIKFQCTWIEGKPLPAESVRELNRCRKWLYRKGWIGAYGNGVGFGNISIRTQDPGWFIITGSGTGRLKRLKEEHFSLVLSVDFERNALTCRGGARASSESMTHAAVYYSVPAIRAVVHIHDLKLWESLLGRVPTTSASAGYGTPEMAFEVMRLFKETDVLQGKIFVMGGHREGIVVFGRDLEEVKEALLRAVKIRKRR